MYLQRWLALELRGCKEEGIIQKFNDVLRTYGKNMSLEIGEPIIEEFLFVDETDILLYINWTKPKFILDETTILGRNDNFRIGRNRQKIGRNGFWAETTCTQIIVMQP